MKNVILITVGVLIAATSCWADSYNENPEKDAWLYPGSGPYGSSTELRINRPPYLQWPLLAWDLTDVMGATIDSATFYVYCYQGQPGGLTGKIYQITEDWDEYTIVAPGPSYDDSEVWASGPAGMPAGWKEFDLTDLVQEWADETLDNYGILCQGEGTSAYYQRWFSREAGSNKPYLEIEYTTLVLPGEFALLTPEDGEVIEVFTRGEDTPEYTARAVKTAGGDLMGVVTIRNRTADPVDVDVEFT
ncbi:MAG: DNRLRE domain-containing protein, partial [Gammaproteobacteria bacterium]|nr:DNRLRE domain-containing protein [Gammaproteobacteria bacterium]